MADSKLSQLTAASTPTGSELVYVVQGGNSRRTTAQALANLAPGTDLAWDATTRTITSSTGADVVLSLATSALPGLMSAADKALVGVASTVPVAVRNNSGVTIPKGSAVYVVNTSGTTITVALADASTEATAAQTLGLAQDAISNNTNGTVIAVGELTGLDTSALTEGATIWLSETTGALTTTRPTQPAHGVSLGYCVKSGPGTSGIVYVKVDNGQELDELHDVLITGATAGQVLRRASDGLWKNAQLAYTDLSGTPDLAGTYQPLDADLTAIAALTTDAYGRSLLTATSAAGARSLLDAAQSAHGHWLFSSSNDGFVPSPGALGANYYLNAAGTWTVPAGGGGGSYSSFSAPTGFSVSGSGTASIVLSYAAGYALPTTASQANWDTAYAERAQWDGGATGLTAATGRASLGLGDSATRNVGTAGGTVAAGDDSRIVGALQATTAATTYQPLDADLTAIAALSTTTFGRSLLTQADAAATITTLGALSTAAAATTYQPLDADLSSIAALSTTTFGRSLLTQADAPTARATLDAAQAAHVHAVFTSSAAGYVPASGGGTTNFLRADGTFAAPPGGGGGGVTFSVYATGNYIQPVQGALSAGVAMVANNIYLYPFFVLRTMTADDLGARVTTLSAGSNVQLAIYNSTSNAVPTTLLASTANLSVGATGTVNAAVTAFTLNAGQLYWMAMNSSGTPVMMGIGATSNYYTTIFGSTSLADVSAGSGVSVGRTIGQTFGTWPDLTSVSTTIDTNRRGGLVWLKVATLT